MKAYSCWFFLLHALAPVFAEDRFLGRNAFGFGHGRHSSEGAGARTPATTATATPLPPRASTSPSTQLEQKEFTLDELNGDELPPGVQEYDESNFSRHLPAAIEPEQEEVDESSFSSRHLPVESVPDGRRSGGSATEERWVQVLQHQERGRLQDHAASSSSESSSTFTKDNLTVGVQKYGEAGRSDPDPTSSTVKEFVNFQFAPYEELDGAHPAEHPPKSNVAQEASPTSSADAETDQGHREHQMTSQEFTLPKMSLPLSLMGIHDDASSSSEILDLVRDFDILTDPMKSFHWNGSENDKTNAARLSQLMKRRAKILANGLLLKPNDQYLILVNDERISLPSLLVDSSERGADRMPKVQWEEKLTPMAAMGARLERRASAPPRSNTNMMKTKTGGGVVVGEDGDGGASAGEGEQQMMEQGREHDSGSIMIPKAYSSHLGRSRTFDSFFLQSFPAEAPGTLTYLRSMSYSQKGFGKKRNAKKEKKRNSWTLFSSLASTSSSSLGDEYSDGGRGRGEDYWRQYGVNDRRDDDVYKFAFKNYQQHARLHPAPQAEQQQIQMQQLHGGAQTARSHNSDGDSIGTSASSSSSSCDFRESCGQCAAVEANLKRVNVDRVEKFHRRVSSDAATAASLLHMAGAGPAPSPGEAGLVELPYGGVQHAAEHNSRLNRHLAEKINTIATNPEKQLSLKFFVLDTKEFPRTTLKAPAETIQAGTVDEWNLAQEEKKELLLLYKPVGLSTSPEDEVLGGLTTARGRSARALKKARTTGSSQLQVQMLQRLLASPPPSVYYRLSHIGFRSVAKKEYDGEDSQQYAEEADPFVYPDSRDLAGWVNLRTPNCFRRRSASGLLSSAVAAGAGGISAKESEWAESDQFAPAFLPLGQDQKSAVQMAQQPNYLGNSLHQPWTPPLHTGGQLPVYAPVGPTSSAAGSGGRSVPIYAPVGSPAAAAAGAAQRPQNAPAASSQSGSSSSSSSSFNPPTATTQTQTKERQTGGVFRARPRRYLNYPLHELSWRQVPVYVNVYDLDPPGSDFPIQTVNGVFKSALQLGGLFHAGIEIHNREFSFGYVPHGTGLETHAPKQHHTHAFRESIFLGFAYLSVEELGGIVGALESRWPGNSYDLLARNCCNFSDEFAQLLGLGGIPSWIHRFARWGNSLMAKFGGGGLVPEGNFDFDIEGTSGSAASPSARTRGRGSRRTTTSTASANNHAVRVLQQRTRGGPEQDRSSRRAADVDRERNEDGI